MTTTTLHIVAIAYDGEVSAIARQDIGELINDLIDNHGGTEVQYRYTETPEGIEQLIEQIEAETGYRLSYNAQEVDITEPDDVRGCSCGMADYGAPGHDGGPEDEKEKS